MTVLVWVFALIAAAVHLLVFVLEAFLIDRPAVYQRFFALPADHIPVVRLWAFGVGFYNLFIGLGLVGGVVAWMAGYQTVGRTLVLYLLVFTLLGSIDEICEAAAESGLEEVTIGMAHRGRLNVLANIVGKKYSQIFREFEGNIDPRTVQGSGDVKYHLGAEGEFVAGSGDKIKVSVAANPSHLEAVDPVLEGIARAKQDVLNRGAEYPVLPLLVHGDAAFAGQGVVAETLNLSQLRGYRTGGTIHLVVNNQVGFTTSPGSSRSSLYCTDVARMVQAPIFHVNGDDPEACIRVARLAFEYRQAFNKDVVIDLVCYRRRGHNEGDDPSYTQPLMYDLIEQKRSVRKLYTESLIGRGDITIEEAEQVLKDYQQQLERVFTEVREASAEAPSEWTTVPDYPEKSAGAASTAVSQSRCSSGSPTPTSRRPTASPSTRR